MNVSNREMRDILDEWAQYNAYDQINIGYPSRNILHDLKKSKMFLPSTPNQEKSADEPYNVQEINRLFRELYKINIDLYTIMRAKFLFNVIYKQDSVVNTIMARSLNISIRTLQDRIKRGVEWFEENFKKKVNEDISYLKAA